MVLGDASSQGPRVLLSKVKDASESQFFSHGFPWAHPLRTGPQSARDTPTLMTDNLRLRAAKGRGPSHVATPDQCPSPQDFSLED